MTKIFETRNREDSLFSLPDKAFDCNLGMPDADHVERIRLPAASRRRGGTRLDNQRRMAVYLVALRRVSGMTDMQMAGKKKISAALSQANHCQARASY